MNNWFISDSTRLNLFLPESRNSVFGGFSNWDSNFMPSLYNFSCGGNSTNFSLWNLPVLQSSSVMASFNSKVQRPLVTAMSNAKISKELNINIPEWKESLKKLQSNF